MIELREEDKKLISRASIVVEEVFHEMRKTQPQNFYVIKVLKGEEWDDDRLEMYPIPDHLLGFWRMKYPDDLAGVSVRHAILHYDWVRCEKVPVTTYEWKITEDKAPGPYDKEEVIFDLSRPLIVVEPQ
jgi:hypothetical protein